MIKEVHETVLWHWGSMTFHGKTLIMTWISMAAVMIFVFAGVRNLTSGKPGKMQNVLEWIIDFVRGIINDNMEYEKGRPLLSYLVTLFMFVFFSNMLGLIPNFTFNLLHDVHFAQLGHIFETPGMMSPTADINTTFSLALLTIILVVSLGIKHKGAHYFHHFIEPNPVFVIIHAIDLLAKPMTLAFRLFGNIFAGEILLGVILMLPGIWVLPGILPTTIWLAFSIFIGAIQSYVFVVLTTAYVSQAVTSDAH
ncbi:F0F1-type ATP synthase, alpha subunit [Desulfosporosinus youngiae DSM 17734]|uniref:ATP synthase subunit a n=1 Tax=Desulfosporosinus youngiae DSM 17734 TaxID=768710 RepID=H5Y0L0_9FIRM|nr:F0F1-type ATP synthase, alpha subunit [Desulfosporosinus youngiae DSM 17734]